MDNRSAGVTEAQQLRALPWFLAHGFLNTLFALWTFGGSVFLLFLSELGLPKGQIGVVLALFPFCGVLALGFAPVATRWGWKRVFLACYGTRKVVIALLLLLPVVLAAAGPTGGLSFLFLIIIGFALLRALAETAFYPWSQEFIPNHMRGKVAGLNTMLNTVAAGLALGIAGHYINHGTGWSRFLVLIAAGCSLGLLGVTLMVRVPGGAPRPEPVAGGVHWANMAQALRDRNFVAFLGGSGCVTLGTMLFTSFLPLYVKERLGIAAGTVVRLDIVVMAGGALAALLLGLAADRVGSRPVLLFAAVLTLVVPLGWLLLPRQIPHALAGCVTLYFLNGVAGSGVAIAANRLLFNSVIPPQQSTAYTAINYAWSGVTGGIAPLLAGALLTTCGGWHTRVGFIVVDSHALLFLGALVALALGGWLFGRVRPDGRHTPRSVLNELLVPALRRRLLQPWR